MTSVNLQQTLEYIGEGAFSGCSNVTEFTIPNTVKHIGGYAFSGTGITTLTIPKSVVEIGYYQYGNATYMNPAPYCTKLEAVIVEEGNPVFVSENGVLFDKDKSWLMCYPPSKTDTAYTTPNTVIFIASRAFANCKNLRTFTIGSSVRSVLKEAFANCESLKTLTIGRNLKDLGSSAFLLCSELKDIYCHVVYNDSYPTDLLFGHCSNVFTLSFDYSNPVIPTLHVPAGNKQYYERWDYWNWMTIVEMASVDPITTETTVSTEGLGSEDLTDNVIGDVYYNVGEGGYDSSDGSVVIGATTNMGQITDATPGSYEVINNFTGIILKLAAGKGSVKVNAKTTGTAQLVVQVGNETPIIVSQAEQGDVVVDYDVEEDTYVYVYAVMGGSAAHTRASSPDVVKIYSISVAPDPTGINSPSITSLGKNVYFTLDGRRLDGKPTTKGLYIRNDRKVLVK